MSLYRGTETVHQPTTLSTDRAIGTLKYWMICVAGVAGLVIASQSHRFLPHKLFLDEAIILRFITGELTSDGPSSYGTTGWLYRVTGLSSIPELFPILAYAVFAVTVIIAITWRGIRSYRSLPSGWRPARSSSAVCIFRSTRKSSSSYRWSPCCS